MYVLTAITNGTLHLPPAIFSTIEKAREKMKKEYINRQRIYKENSETIMEAIIDEDSIYIVTDEGNYIEWNISECEVDEL